MRISIKDGVEVAEFTEAELVSVDARIKALDAGEARTYSEAELDEKWRREDAERDERRAA